MATCAFLVFFATSLGRPPKVGMPPPFRGSNRWALTILPDGYAFINEPLSKVRPQELEFPVPPNMYKTHVYK